MAIVKFSYLTYFLFGWLSLKARRSHCANLLPGKLQKEFVRLEWAAMEQPGAIIRVYREIHTQR